MGGQIETFKDNEGNNHLIFDKSALYKDLNFGDKLSDFEILRVLGSFNGENVISKVRSLKNNKLYAMKKVELNKIKNEQEKQLCLDQMEKLKTINHPHLLEYYKTFKDENNNIYMIYEYMNNSDLNSFIKAHQYLEKNVNEDQIWNILLQCLSGLEYLHSKNLESLAIKPTNIFLNNEQNSKIGLFYDTPKLSDKNYYKKNDIYFIGLYFYKMVFSQYDFISGSSWIDDFPVEKIKNNFYSEELLNIIYEMINENPNNVKTSSELYALAKREYSKKFTNNTSINGVLRCLYSFPEFNKFFLKNENYIKTNQEKCQVSYWLLNVINSILNNNNNNLNECIKEFRRALATDNTKLDGSKEIDPVYLLAFLFEKIHKESIKKSKTEIKKKNINEVYVINSRYKAEEVEDKENKDQMLNKFIHYFLDNMMSFISNSFFGFMKRKRICTVCKNGSYSFSNFCFIPYDLTKFTDYQCFDLINNGFLNNYNECKKVKNLFCDRCLAEQEHNEFNRIYSTCLNLIICFYRGRNYENNLFVNFPDNLNISNYVEAKGSPTSFHLVGSINRIINNGKEEFIYFAKDPYKSTFWTSNYGGLETVGAPIQNIQQFGQIVILFYTSL